MLRSKLKTTAVRSVRSPSPLSEVVQPGAVFHRDCTDIRSAGRRDRIGLLGIRELGSAPGSMQNGYLRIKEKRLRPAPSRQLSWEAGAHQ